jgi:hypothetical protein
MAVLVRCTGPDHIVLRTRDPVASCAWYQRTLGLAPVRLDEFRAGKQHPDTSTRALPHAGPRPPPPTLSFTHTHTGKVPFPSARVSPTFVIGACCAVCCECVRVHPLAHVPSSLRYTPPTTTATTTGHACRACAAPTRFLQGSGRRRRRRRTARRRLRRTPPHGCVQRARPSLDAAVSAGHSCTHLCMRPCNCTRRLRPLLPVRGRGRHRGRACAAGSGGHRG